MAKATKNKMELTSEEVELIQQHRDEKQKAEEAEKARAEKDAQREGLEQKFEAALQEAKEVADQHVKAADAEIKKAMKVAEKYGVPIHVNLICMPKSREYFPASFEKKWPEVDDELLESFDLFNDESGWEYWSASSLTC